MSQSSYPTRKQIIGLMTAAGWQNTAADLDKVERIIYAIIDQENYEESENEAIKHLRRILNLFSTYHHAWLTEARDFLNMPHP